jgi:nitrate reductase NapE component
MTQPPPQQPPTQVFVQQRRSGCGTLLVALLVLATITAIVIFLGAFGLLDWIFS